jgi:hypothetical protein
MVIVHRRDAENAKERWIFLFVHPLESEADMKGKKEKICSQGTTLDVSQIVRPSFRIGPEFQCIHYG